MAKWEYISIYVDSFPIGFSGVGLKVRTINGQELPNWKEGLSIYDHISQLGEQGWEMVSTPTLPSPFEHNLVFSYANGAYWFKRQKQ